MKTIAFLTQTKQLYYNIEKLKFNRGIYSVTILFKELTYDKTIKKIKNRITTCYIRTEDIPLVKKLMSSKSMAVQYLNYEYNLSIAHLAQLKVSCGNPTIKMWNPKWKIIT